MSAVRPVRGTHDLLGEDMLRHRRVAEVGRDTAQLYGYGEISTPIFEFTEVFARTLGDTSDIVTKEMYTFEDQGGKTLLTFHEVYPSSEALEEALQGSAAGLPEQLDQLDELLSSMSE